MTWRNVLTALIYAFAALAACVLWLTMSDGGFPWDFLLTRSLLFLGPLLFVFAYPKFLFAGADAGAKSFATRVRSAAVLHGVGAVTATIAFVILASSWWHNPLFNAGSVTFFATTSAADLLFLAAAILMLAKRRAILPVLASFLLWPYWLALALAFCDRFFREETHSAFSFLCLTASLFLAFAAGAVFYRATIAHCAALAALVAAPLVYSNVIRDTSLGNVWTSLNVPDQMKWGKGNFLFLTILTILSTILIALGVATAAFRLTPTRWKIVGTPLRDRTWPAFLLTFAFLAVWFSQSVMPYRASGAVDYSQFPLLKILHVQKQGLQFHETCIGLWGYHKPDEFSLSSNDRRLFHYRIRETGSHTGLPDSFRQRAGSILDSLRGTPGNSGTGGPLRAWNDEGWYLLGENIPFRAYTAGATPPPEILALFHDIESLPRQPESASDLKDICLGFCYDPLAGLGRIYANYRCGWDSVAKRYVCR
jgi:hypothetical protein